MNTNAPITSREITRREQSFPLIAIVQLVTYCVALVTCIDFKALGKQVDSIPNVDVAMVVALPVAAALLGFVLGGAIGLGQIHRWRGLLICGTAGAVVGLLVLSTMAAPAPPLQACFACALPLVTTVVLRYRAS